MFRRITAGEQQLYRFITVVIIIIIIIVIVSEKYSVAAAAQVLRCDIFSPTDHNHLHVYRSPEIKSLYLNC